MEEFEDTKFATGGGVAFECSDYEGMHVELRAFLRSSMASLLCYMAERMPEHEEGYPDPYSEETDNSSDGFNRAIDDCRTLLIEEARKILEK